MFDFVCLDEVDDGDAAPEWMKWQGEPDWQRARREPLAVLEDLREEQFAAPEDEEYVYEKLEIPFLPDDPFDPVGLNDDTAEQIEENMAVLNGEVIVQYLYSAYEQDFMMAQEKEEKKSYIDSLHQERMVMVERMGKSRQDLAHKDSAGSRQFDRKKFSWRELTTMLVGNIIGLPDGGVFAENVLTVNDKLQKSLTKVSNTIVMPTASLIQMVATMGNQVRPMPQGRMGRNAAWHLTVSDIFFPSCLVFNDGKDVLEKSKEAPTLVHLVAMSINKEAGELEAKRLLENVKLESPSNFNFKNMKPIRGLNVNTPD